MSTFRHRPIQSDPDTLCMHRSVALAVVVGTDGVPQYCSWCYDCERRSSSYSHRELAAAGIDLDALEVVRDNSPDAPEPEPCEVCGNPSQELHHIAPRTFQAYFTRSVETDWPQMRLCKPCHDEWHRVVTPDLVMHSITLHELGAKRGMTFRELTDRARQHLAARSGPHGMTRTGDVVEELKRGRIGSAIRRGEALQKRPPQTGDQTA